MVIKTMPGVRSPMGEGEMDVARPGCQLCSYAAHPARRQPSCSSPQARAIFISFHSVAKDMPPSLSCTLINLSSGPVLFLSNYPITLRLWVPSQERTENQLIAKGNICIYAFTCSLKNPCDILHILHQHVWYSEMDICSSVLVIRRENYGWCSFQ